MLQLLDALFRRRKILWHCAAKLFYGLANLAANGIMRSVCSILSLNAISAQFFFCLRCAEKIGCEFRASHMVKNILILF